jgi:signal transduction histidine kinase
MQAMGSTAVAERRRVEAVVETLAAIHNHGESLVELAHDARNMVTALSLYCDLLEEPGVLSPAHRHYGSELRLVAEACRSLVEKLARFDHQEEPGGRPTSERSLEGRLFPEKPRSDRPPAQPTLNSTILHPTSLYPRLARPVDDFGGEIWIDDVQEEVLASRNVLAAIAGPSIALTVESGGGAAPVQMRSEDLIRVLVNLVKNAAEGIAGAGAIRLALTDRKVASEEASAVVLAVEDTGAGIAEELLDRVFEPGFTTRTTAPAGAGWASGGRRGLGLAITRSIVEAAGGKIHAGNQAGGGARFVIELPVRTS